MTPLLQDAPTPEALAAERAEARARRTWVAIILGLLGLVLVVHAVLIVVATGDPSAVAEPDYYRKSLAWDDVLERRRRAAELGWELELAARPAGMLRELNVRLVDRAGGPIADAELWVEAFHKARGAQRVEAPLEACGEGRYRATLPLRRPGLWELRVVVRRADDELCYTRVRELPPLSGS